MFKLVTTCCNISLSNYFCREKIDLGSSIFDLSRVPEPSGLLIIYYTIVQNHDRYPLIFTCLFLTFVCAFSMQSVLSIFSKKTIWLSIEQFLNIYFRFCVFLDLINNLETALLRDFICLDLSKKNKIKGSFRLWPPETDTKAKLET